MSNRKNITIIEENDNNVINALTDKLENNKIDINKSNFKLNDIKKDVKQRIVNSNLGKNITKDHEQIYEAIEQKIGLTKKCNFGHEKGSKTGVKHEGDKNVNIRNFELRGVKYDEETKKVIFEKNSDGLQGFCKDCSKRRRKARITTQEEIHKDKTPKQIYEYYIEKYGKKDKTCSKCKEDLNIEEFNISSGMECGLHNLCKKCSHDYGNSVGDRWLIYLPDGNYNYNKKDTDFHDDHIFPVSLGGSNNKINHQLLEPTKNISKSNNIEFENINDIDEQMISERFRKILISCLDINDLKIKLTKAIYDDILVRSKKSDEELEKIYSEYCKKNNLRKDVKRAVKKFRKFCIMRDIK